MISLPPRLRRASDDSGQALAVVVGLVRPVAVGRFDEQDIEGVRAVRRLRIRKNGPVVASEIAAEQQRPARDADPGEGGAEQVAGVHELDFNAGNDGHGPVVAHRLQLHQRP